MRNLTTSFDGREILVQMRKDLDDYKKSQYSKQYIIEKKEKLISDLYNVMCEKSETTISLILKALEFDIDLAMQLDPQIGFANIIIPLRFNKKETVFINCTENDIRL
jgi:hypothetical protein